MRKPLVCSLLLLGCLFWAQPAAAEPRYGVAFGWYDLWNDYLVLGNLHVPVIPFGGRVSLGIGGFGGVVIDNNDPAKRYHYHAHPTAGAILPLDIRLGGSDSKVYLSLAPGLGWTMPKRVWDHAPNYFVVTAGINWGF